MNSGEPVGDVVKAARIEAAGRVVAAHLANFTTPGNDTPAYRVILKSLKLLEEELKEEY